MLRVVQSTSAGQAKRYYTEGLEREDYFLGRAELPGRWGGKGAVLLGLEGEVGRDSFHHLCENHMPDGEGKLTARTKANRRVGYDFNFHCPKSVSLAHALGGDERILPAMFEAVDEAMRRMEEEAATRVRRGGRNETRTTGNLVWAAFPHQTARPVDGVPDPHLHVHCYVFNATFDETEGCWKAGEFGGLKRSAPYFEALFHAGLERRVRKLGYETEERGDRWEIKGLNSELLAKFSRRTEVIEAVAAARGIEDAEAKAALGAKSRRSKKEGLAFDEVRREWVSRLTSADRETVRQVSVRSQDAAPKSSINREPRSEHESVPGFRHRQVAKRAVDRALEHCFERRSVADESRVLAAALRFSHGRSSEEAIRCEFESRDLLRKSQRGRNVVAMKEVVEEEKKLVALARAGVNAVAALGEPPRTTSTPTEVALAHLLSSRDRVTAVRAGPNVDSARLREEIGKRSRLCRFAPSQGSRDGQVDTESIAKLLGDEGTQCAARRSIIWVEEASRVGTRDAVNLLEIATKLRSRVIFAGDRRRHGATSRGDVLHLLEHLAKVRPQGSPSPRRSWPEPASVREQLARGEVRGALTSLHAADKVREVPCASWGKVLAADFARHLKQGRRCLTVVENKGTATRLTGELRDELRSLGAIGKKERVFESLSRVSGTLAERQDPTFYKKGQVVQFRQNAKGFRAGVRYTIVGRDPFGHVLARHGLKLEALPLRHADRFEVFDKGEIGLSVGDRVRMTRSGYAKSAPLFPGVANRPKRHRVEAGAIRTVASFTRSGDVRLDTGVVVPKDFAYWEHGFCVTSHEAQGRRADHVRLCVSGQAQPESLHVAVSCAKRALGILTEDRNALFQSEEESPKARPSALRTFEEYGRDSEESRHSRSPDLANGRE